MLKFRMILSAIACLLIVTSSASVSTVGASDPPELRAFDFSGVETGWVLLGSRLYATSDGGKTWHDITPPLTDGLEIGDAAFVEGRGWAILTRPAGSKAAYALADTTDHGQHWSLHDLELFSDAEAWILPRSTHLFFLDTQHGWLVVRHATGVNFNVGSLFRTTDGGVTWERLTIPIGEPVFFETPDLGWTTGGVLGNETYRTRNGGQTWEPLPPAAPDLPPALRFPVPAAPSEGNITRLDMVTERAGWAQISAGECTHTGGKTAIECVTSTSLRRTLDGGQTWQLIPLPSIPDGSLENRTVHVVEAAASSFSAAGAETITGQGFDICEIPNLSKLQMWWDASPYTAVNLYIGGSSRSCSNANLSASFLTQLQQQGWKFIPTWVGPQAPCTNYSSKIPLDPGEAYFRGVAEADAALAVAQQLGLTDASQSSTVIYYDLEPFNIDNTACLNAVKNMVVGWSERMQAAGNTAGVYGSYYSGMATFASHPTVVPDAVWLAHWISSSYDSTATVWDVFRIPNTLWPDHQRIRQYAGDHNETWGGLTLNIDSNVLDGVVAVRADGLTSDDFDAARPIQAAPYADSRAIAGATTAPDDPILPCTSDQGYQSAWYKFTPAVSGKALVSTRGSNYDTILAVWTGSRGGLVSEGCNFNGQQSEVQFEAAAGMTYFIEVASPVEVAEGTLFLSVYLPANDDFNAAQVVNTKLYQDQANTTGAGDSSDDPVARACNLAPGLNSVWYTYTPASSGLVSMDTLGSNYDTYIAVWSGTRGALAPVACNDDYGGQQSRLEADLTGGTTYSIQIAQYKGDVSPLAQPLAQKPAAEVTALAGGMLHFHITSFFDVPGSHQFWTWIERLGAAGITQGCGVSPKTYCPDDPVTRAQMAVFLLRGIYGASHTPSPAGGHVFADVPTDHWAAPWIEQLLLEGITAGCGDGNYCPENNVTRAQMAVFLLRAKHGANYIPPAASGTMFGDVPSTNWAAAWIEQLYSEGITAGCGNGNYCPENDVTRAEMAVFLVRTFGLP